MTKPIDLPSPSFAWPRTDIEAARERNFAATMDLVAERHPFYWELLASNVLVGGDFATLADMAKLPITTKQDLMNRRRWPARAGRTMGSGEDVKEGYGRNLLQRIDPRVLGASLQNVPNGGLVQFSGSGKRLLVVSRRLHAPTNFALDDRVKH